MRARALEIAWHESTSVWAVDTAMYGGVTRLVTGGGDKIARIWRLKARTAGCISEARCRPGRGTESEVDVEWICDLRSHSSTVNVVRFSPSGDLVATGADGGEIVLWALENDGDEKDESASPAFAAGNNGTERWVHKRTLRGHTHDVLDVAWGQCGTMLASASVDNAVMVWRIGGTNVRAPFALRQSANFVQGVAFSGDGGLLASLGNDRLLRVYKRRRVDGVRWYVIASVGTFGVDRLFVDDFNSKNVFRRLAWSPDANLLACPSGIDVRAEGKKSFAVHLFARTSLLAPLVQCGGLPRPAVAVRFCPILYTRRKRKTPPADPMDIDCAAGTAGSTSCSLDSNAAANGVEGDSKGSEPHLVSSGGDTKVQQSNMGCGAANGAKGIVEGVQQAKVKSVGCDSGMGDTQARGAGEVAGAAPSENNEVTTQTRKGNVLSALKYRMVFAVVCTDAIYVYDTEMLGRAIARVRGLHLAEHTDVCWTPDGRSLFVSSTDGYVSTITFSADELGTPLPKSAYPPLRAETGVQPTAKQPPPPFTASKGAQPMVVVPKRAGGPGVKNGAAAVGRNSVSSRVSDWQVKSVSRKRKMLQADVAAAQRQRASKVKEQQHTSQDRGHAKAHKVEK